MVETGRLEKSNCGFAIYLKIQLNPFASHKMAMASSFWSLLIFASFAPVLVTKPTVSGPAPERPQHTSNRGAACQLANYMTR